MPRTKKIKEVTVEKIAPTLIPLITHLSIDYPNEGLNDMARKINEIIDRINE